MNASADDVKSIFGQALALHSPAERAAFLDEACGANAALRSEVASLLEALEKSPDFMKREAPSLPLRRCAPLSASTVRRSWRTSAWGGGDRETTERRPPTTDHRPQNSSVARGPSSVVRRLSSLSKHCRMLIRKISGILENFCNFEEICFTI